MSAAKAIKANEERRVRHSELGASHVDREFICGFDSSESEFVPELFVDFVPWEMNGKKYTVTSHGKSTKLLFTDEFACPF